MKELANKLSAASYTRLANADPEREAEQLDANAACAARIDALIPETLDFRFSDRGTSGRSAERPGLQRMKAAVAAGAPFRIIIAQDAARLARDPIRFAEELRWFRERGIRWVFASDAPRDLPGADDRWQAHAKYLRAARAAKRARDAVRADISERAR